MTQVFSYHTGTHLIFSRTAITMMMTLNGSGVLLPHRLSSALAGCPVTVAMAIPNIIIAERQNVHILSN